MEKYIVIVNRKYLVSVEANTNGGAEHKCLDLHYGIKTAQAFSLYDLRTECFRDMAIECETISFAELSAKSDTFRRAVEYETEVRKAIKDNLNQIEELNREVALIEDNNALLKINLNESIEDRQKIF